MGYTTGIGGYLGAYPEQQGGDSWIESTIVEVGSWISGLFGQAEERDARRFAQNVAAFRAAARGGTWDAEFLKARSGAYGMIDIPVRLPYAVSPSDGAAETPGQLGGWATGPAKRHAAELYARLLEGGADPGDVPGDGGVDPAVLEELYRTARTSGRSAAEALLQTIAATIYGAIPPEYRAAVEQGVRDHYAREAGGAANAAVPWIVGAGLVLAVLRYRRRR